MFMISRNYEKQYKPVLHFGYAFQASSCSTRASSGAKVVSQVGALLQNAETVN